MTKAIRGIVVAPSLVDARRRRLSMFARGRV
jgi:hypothetical protein